MQIQPNRIVFPILGLSILGLLFALWAGLQRIGWVLPPVDTRLRLAHGPLMISGFLGSLITLERVVALRKKWLYIIPLLCGFGWLALLIGYFSDIGLLLLIMGSFGGILISSLMVRREPHLHTVTMWIGAFTWFVGNLLWLLGIAIYDVVYLWQAFLILTIVGERLELSQILNISLLQKRLFLFAGVIFLVGVVLTTINPQVGIRLSGLGMLALALWSFKNDISRRNIRHPAPLTRYIAVALLSGFVWLGIGGVLNLWLGAQYFGRYYDASLHAIFVGFVISMIFGHAPIIFPAILGVPLTFFRIYYVHLGLLHLSLVLRLFGDLADWPIVRLWGGLLNEIAILMFLGVTIFAIRKGMRAA